MIFMDPDRLQGHIDELVDWMRRCKSAANAFPTPFRSIEEVIGAARLYHATIPKPPVEPQWFVTLWKDEKYEVHLFIDYGFAEAKMRWALRHGYVKAEIQGG